MVIEYLFVKTKDDFCVNVEGFKKYLESNMRIKFENNEVTIDKKKYRYKLAETVVEKSNEIVFHFGIEPSSSSLSEAKQLESLENASSVLQRINDKYEMFKIYTIWDDISMYYTKKLYSPIEKIENQLRKIIYLFMTKTVGTIWTKENMPASVQNDIEKTKSKNALTNTDDVNLLYYADFIVLGAFFFGRYSLNNNYTKLIEQLQIPENQTNEKIMKLAEEFEIKSNWERYFKDKIEVDKLEEKWKKIYHYRNIVAHSKQLRKKEYDEATSLINEIDKAFSKCIDLIDDVDFTEEESKAVEKVANATIASPDLSVNSRTFFKKTDLWGDFTTPNLSTNLDIEPFSLKVDPEIIGIVGNGEMNLLKSYAEDLKISASLAKEFSLTKDALIEGISLPERAIEDDLIKIK